MKALNVTNGEEDQDYFALLFQIRYVNRYYSPFSGGRPSGVNGIHYKIKDIVFADSLGEDLNYYIKGIDMENKVELILEDTIKKHIETVKTINTISHLKDTLNSHYRAKSLAAIPILLSISKKNTIKFFYVTTEKDSISGEILPSSNGEYLLKRYNYREYLDSVIHRSSHPTSGSE